MDFNLGDEHRLIQQTVRDFATQEVAPVAEELDRESARELLAARLATQAREDEAAEAAAEAEAAASKRDEPARTSGGRKVGSQAWNTVEDIAATVAPHGRKSLVRSGVKLLRSVLGNRSR